jgi:hypothetical protein
MPSDRTDVQEAPQSRRRICQVCGKEFVVAKSSHVGRSCSKEHASILLSAAAKGRVQSEETKLKRAASIRAIRADPERNAAWTAAAAAGLGKWHENPENAARFSERSSARMKKRHADPEWQAVRNERSSRTMKRNWEKHRDAYVAAAVERYASGGGLADESVIERKIEGARWIMTKAQAALRSETSYEETFARVQARLRDEDPYAGSSDADYADYLQELGRRTTADAECREIADPFLSAAIPRIAAEWRSLRGSRDAAYARRTGG